MEMEQMKMEHEQKVQESVPNNQSSNKNTPQQQGRSPGSNKKDNVAVADRKSIQETIYHTEQLFSFAQKQMKQINNIKRLSKEKKSLLDELCKSVIISCEKEQWESNVKACVEDFENISKLSTLPDISEAAHENDMELYPSALYYHSQKKEEDSQK
jgi:hypothetical protein